MPKLKIDLHVHTDYSDSTGRLESIVQTAVAKGLDGIAVTDHDTCEAAILAVKRYSQKIIVVPGLEYAAKEGHILALGLLEAPPKGLAASEVSGYIHARGALVVAAHPKIPFLGMNLKALRYLNPDAVETHNAATPFYNWTTRRATRLAERLQLPQTGGSDAHDGKSVGDSYTIIDSDSTELVDILQAIKDGRTTPKGNPSPVLYRMKLWLSIGLM